MDIRLDYNFIHSHTDKPRCISGYVLHEISEFYTCHHYGCAPWNSIRNVSEGLNNRIFKYIQIILSEIIMGTLSWQSFS